MMVGKKLPGLICVALLLMNLLIVVAAEEERENDVRGEEQSGR